MIRFASVSGLALAAALAPAGADVSQETLDSLSAPPSTETRIGTLGFELDLTLPVSLGPGQQLQLGYRAKQPERKREREDEQQECEG